MDVTPLKSLGACSDAIKWAKTLKTPEEAWATCDRGDWMLWLAGKHAGEPFSDARRKLVLAACECARLVLPRVKPGEGRPRIAIETAERWATVQDVSYSDVRNAAGAAYAAGGAAYAAAGAAAYAAADAAYSAEAAAYAAYAAADAAYAAAGAAYSAEAAAYAAYAAAGAKTNTLKQCAAIVRKHYPTVDDAMMMKVCTQ